MATNDLTTLDDVKAWLAIGLGDSTYDSMLSRLVTACSTTMQAYMNRIVAVTAYSTTFSGDGKDHKMVPNYPIQSVTQVTVNGVVVPQGVAPTPTASQQSGWFFDEDTVWLSGWRFCEGLQNCSLSYTAGFSPTDPNLSALAQACIEVVSYRFRERSRIGERNKSVNGEVIGFALVDFPPEVMTLMNNLRNVVPV